MPGAAVVMKGIVRGASDALIAALVAEPQLTVVVRTTLTGELPMEHYLQLCRVFRKGEFLEIYDQTRQYEVGDEVHTPDSAWDGVVYMSFGERIANVIGSTGDPTIGGMWWIRLWAGEVSGFYPSVCTSQNYGVTCDTNLVGGHVIEGTIAMSMPPGSKVYIFPICSTHNNKDYVNMAAVTYLEGCALKNYMGT
ncbi:hypothetical protein L207DRAFT_517210 [Hyaloscypha variabilis F]|uniref:Uncharacterized protein n=1 Tax=Hyaloscypha variabilis (strain UAMH 11265 / GT02V1 / F) TaxID=1149755 RepID=A0A2J6R9A1_HYAVF|nr:hypothetical protein L207DRAFT_517210 [Hyaloscypha variabilis F]